MCSCRYYYDAETGWYYLQSRYYDPVIHRFINADTFASTGQGFLGCNMFAYCLNNPVIGMDPAGESIIAIIGLVIGLAGLAMGLSGCSSNPYAEAPDDFYYYPAENYNGGWHTMPNCYGYAWGNVNYIDPGEMAESQGVQFSPKRASKDQPYSRKTMIAAVEADGKAFGRPAREITSPSDVRSNEYLVVCKLYDGGKDYHFVKQLGDGTWADKFGTSASRWNEIDGLAPTWVISIGSKTWRYDSTCETIYFAFTKGS